MSVRRRDSRVEFANTEGHLRVWQDASGYHMESGDYVVISTEARLRGDRLTMYLPPSKLPVPVRVLDSRPTVINGLVRHQLRLQPVLDGVAGTETRRDDGLETK